MRRSPEIVVLFVLLVISIAGVLWYVIDRRTKMRAAAPPVAARTAPAPTGAAPGPLPPPGPAAAPVDLAAHDRQTIDFSSGQPVVKNSAADQAAIDAAMKDIAAATQDANFAPPPKPAPAKP